jgi:glycosyltransferase involved in cell wall biosynthesis
MPSFIQRQELISVIIPVFNASKFVDKAIDSILKQSYKKIELILIDDGSEDNSLKIMNSYKKIYKDIKIISQKNYGAGIARNQGIDVAKGKYIMFLDADDFFEKGCCANALKQIQKHNADFVSFGAYFLDKKNRMSSSFGFENKHLQGLDIIKSYFTGSDIKNVIWNKIYKKSFLNQFNIRFNKARVNEDSFFVMSACLNAKRVSFCSGYFYTHTRLNMQSFTNRVTSDHFVHSLRVLKAEKALLSKKNLLPLLQYHFNIHAAKFLTYIIFMGGCSNMKYDDYLNGAGLILNSKYWKEISNLNLFSMPLLLNLRLIISRYPKFIWLSGRVFSIN